MARVINVFIGSSKERLDFANELKSLFEENDEFYCTIWNQCFEFNKDTLTILNTVSYQYDFAILLATNDDLGVSRNQIKNLARDNVIFEYGLFLGAMSKNRAFLVCENSVDLPSDLDGYNLAKFSQNQLADLTQKLIPNFLEQFQKSEIQPIPSTSLAIGYFESFLRPLSKIVYDRLKSRIILNKKKFEETATSIQVIIPEELSDNISHKAKIYFNKRSLDSDEIGDSDRPFPIRFFRNEEGLQVIDMPTILNAVRPAVNLLIPESGLGKSTARVLVERKELENFKKTLEYLVSEDDHSKALVSIVWEENQAVT